MALHGVAHVWCGVCKDGMRDCSTVPKRADAAHVAWPNWYPCKLCGQPQLYRAPDAAHMRVEGAQLWVRYCVPALKAEPKLEQPDSTSC
eukprot:4481185-Prymnesium_polylepis.1